MKGQWGKLTGYFLGTLILSAAATFGLPLLGGGSWLPDLISREGSRIDDLFWGLLIMSLVIFSIVAAIVIYSIVHFRAEPGDESDGAHIHGNARMELAWIIIPSIIVTIVGVLSFIVLEDNEVGLYDKAAAKEKGAATMAIDVRGFSFGWNFRYEDTDGKLLTAEGVEPSSELVLPVGQVVRFNVMSCSGKEQLGRVRAEVERTLDLEAKEVDGSHAEGSEEHDLSKIQPGTCERQWDMTTPEEVEAAREEAELLHVVREKHADGEDLTEEEQALLDAQPLFHGDNQYVDVNHAFWVPEARLKIDAVSGLRTYVQWKPSRVTGPDDHYQVVCAELCGAGHNGMRTDMCVVDAATFEWWTGLEQDARGDATCVNLRLLSCIDEPGNRDELVTAFAKLTQDSPDATCDEAEEAAA